jgi:N-acetylneuraminate synthase
MSRFRTPHRSIGPDEPTYFIADISANHDGSLDRAKLLVRLAAESGADAAKFQNFRAPKIVSRHGFESIGGQVSHQAKWKKSVYQVYQEATLPWEWTGALKAECDKVGIDYFSAPYDLEAVDMLDSYVGLFKIGSGDITWPDMIRKVASKGKPLLLSTGASDLADVVRAVELVREAGVPLVLMQCNTNYTASMENFRCIHLNVLRTYQVLFPDVLLGLSDHTPGHATALGAVALGARAVEKHFTDDTKREGPDHPFSMTPHTWREMVDRTRELEAALGSPIKRVAANEQQTVVVQRRSLRASRDLKAGAVLTRDDIDALRPAPADGIFPYEMEALVGRRLASDVAAGEHFRWSMVDGWGPR